MPRPCTLLVALFLAFAASSVHAQSIRQQMTAEEFAAAGLDKLSAAELAALDRWLQRQVEEETSVVAEQAREQGRQQAHAESAANPGAPPREARRETFQSSIVGEFNGFGRGQRYTLENGQVWEQTDAARLDGVNKVNPAVTMYPGAFGAWFLRIDGYNTRARVRRVN